LTGAAIGAVAAAYVLSDEKKRAKAKEYVDKAEKGLKSFRDYMENKCSGNFEDGWSDEAFTTFDDVLETEADERG